jgi:hypothetical protein
MLANGRHEINAARQQLVAAKARKSSVTKAMVLAYKLEKSSQRMLKIATRNSETAKKDLQDATRNSENAEKTVEVVREHLATSREEVIAAETQLKEAEKRWAVIDVDMP